MHKKRMKKKAIVLSMGLAAAMLLPTNVSAQEHAKHGGLFGLGDWFETEGLFRGTNEEGMEWEGMTPQDPTEEAPIGSGMLVLMVAGAGYAIVKSKNGKEEQK